ncbi:MAG: hypothetical protein M0Z32_04860 [Actinomycetota bacterium]|nr:hypothetical protein [Actinomycetota bacterium]MCL6094174.1 hypothetical protein [Actinomycetota bacterium]MDA8167069.1 hypothetical protein [Actinomycetota bacterium]
MTKASLKILFDNAVDRLYRDTFNAIPYKISYFRVRSKKDHDSKTVLFYPEKPVSFHVIYKICHILGYKITNNVNARADLVIKFEDKTFSPVDNILFRISESNKILNLRCDDISKEKVDRIFKHVFGYGLCIDPEKHENYVRKSNYNGKHDGVIIAEPTKPETGFVYQLLINNRHGSHVKDMRAPIINGEIPFILLKYNSIEDRFGHMKESVMAEAGAEFNPMEINKILEFTSMMGLDIGALDILRDRDSGKIYIVDVNNTPYGPAGHRSDIGFKKALTTLAESFKENYFT